MTAARDATRTLASMTTANSEVGRIDLNNAATWDDFPNGRFGDFKSPAFGANDLWGNSSGTVVCSFSSCLVYTCSPFVIDQ
jgi:methylenetetrahydrofolate reductase (NADPH)